MWLTSSLLRVLQTGFLIQRVCSFPLQSITTQLHKGCAAKLQSLSDPQNIQERWSWRCLQDTENLPILFGSAALGLSFLSSFVCYFPGNSQSHCFPECSVLTCYHHCLLSAHCTLKYCSTQFPRTEQRNICSGRYTFSYYLVYCLGRLLNDTGM